MKYKNIIIIYTTSLNLKNYEFIKNIYRYGLVIVNNNVMMFNVAHIAYICVFVICERPLSGVHLENHTGYLPEIYSTH